MLPQIAPILIFIIIRKERFSQIPFCKHRKVFAKIITLNAK